MTTFVLVHGAWTGGWVWTRVARRLRAAGHEVFTPTLTGLGERSHLASRDINLETHIADALGVLRFENLNDVVLCGHSYGGMVITGVADRAAERVRALVYLDAFLPADGQALFELIPDGRRQRFLDGARNGDGWRVPIIPAVEWGVEDPADQAWLDRLSVPHPLATLQQPIRLSGAGERITTRTYVLATKYDPSPFQKFAAAVADDPMWRSATLAGYHMLNISMPEEVVAILLRAS